MELSKGREVSSNERIILDLCGGTGAWSRPYANAGYDVRNISSPEYDVRTYQPPAGVSGILAAPPCTEFSVSGVRWWKSKPPELLIEAIEVVRACLRIIRESNPEWWALENPVGRLRRCVPEIGKWRYTFQPYEYGDPWTKRTCIWGEHNIPIKNPVESVGSYQGSGHTAHGKTLGIVDHPLMLLKPDAIFLPPDWIHKLPPSADRSTLRSITPSGFAKAFYEANR